MTIILQDAGNVLMKPFFPGWLYYGFPVLYSKNGMNVQLGKGIRHDDKGMLKINI